MWVLAFGGHPKFYDSQRTSPRSPTSWQDVYSFAMTCYEVLTGKEPFEDELFEGQLKCNEYNKVIKSRLRPKLPENLDDDLTSLIKSCWAHDPNYRPKFVIGCSV